MTDNPYSKATFLKSSAALSQLPEDTGFEVAFVGRSNAGKSSALNVLTGIKNLARISKTPGRTQLINLFNLADTTRRLVDLPGYGYAKVSRTTKLKWQQTLASYLEKRQCLKGLVLLMDIRHPPKDLDITMIDWALLRNLPVHILLTKADKLSYSQSQNALAALKKFFEDDTDMLTMQTFSSLKKTGVKELIKQLNIWFEFSQQEASSE